MKFQRLLNLIVMVVSNPTGSPTCQMNLEAITAGMGEQQQLGFRAVMKKRSNTTFSVEFENSNNVTTFNGILMYVVGKNTSAHIGKFTFERIPTKVQDKWKYVSGDVCTANGVVGLTESTVTHAKPDAVDLEGMFMLEMTTEELKIPDLVLKTVIVSTGASAPVPPPAPTPAPPLGKVQLPPGHPTITNSIVKGHPSIKAQVAAAGITLPGGHPDLDSLTTNGGTIPNGHPPLSNYYIAATAALQKRQAPAKTVPWQYLKDIVITGPGTGGTPSAEGNKNSTSSAISFGSVSAIVLSSIILAI